MTFPERNLAEQYISSSYQDVLQQYVNTGSYVYVLDGYGNVVFGIQTASLGNIVITSDMTSSMTVLSASYSQVIEIRTVSSSFASASISASYALSSSYAKNASIANSSVTSIYSDTASLAVYSDYSGTASLAVNAVTSSYALTASYVAGAGSGLSTGSTYPVTSSQSTTASYALTASYAMNGGSGGGGLETGSTYPVTASHALTASYIANMPSGSTVSASYALTASYAENQGISIPKYDFSYVQYEAPYGQFSKCTYRTGGASGSIVCIVDAYYSGSLFIGVSKSLG